MGHSAPPFREQRPSPVGNRAIDAGAALEGGSRAYARDGLAATPRSTHREQPDRCADPPDPARATCRGTSPWHARVASVGHSAGRPSRIAAPLGDGARRGRRCRLHRRAHRPPGERPGSDRGRRSASTRVTGPGRPRRGSVARQGRCAGHARAVVGLPVPVVRAVRGGRRAGAHPRLRDARHAPDRPP